MFLSKRAKRHGNLASQHGNILKHFKKKKKKKKHQHRASLTHLLHNVRRENPGSEGSAENVGELLVQTSNSHLLKVPVRVDDCLSSLLGFCLTCKNKQTNIYRKFDICSKK